MFQRWQGPAGRTFSYRLFKRHHSEINELYGSHALAAYTAMNAAKKGDKRMKPTAVFNVPRKVKKQMAPTLAQWERDYKNFNNWVRLSAAVAIHAYMEIYLRKISALAVESNPGIIIGAPGAIDGVVLLKSRPNYSYSDYAVHFVKGDWNTRIVHYEKLFGKAPEPLLRHAKELNELRKMRNGVGHSFGRSSSDYEETAQYQLKPMMRLSEERFGQWQLMADEVTSAIDDHLKNSHIGQYELLLYYHAWRAKQKTARPENEPVALQRDIAETIGEQVDADLLHEMIEHYRQC